jgi:hypothetical protein
LLFAAVLLLRTGPTRHSLSESFGHLQRAAGQTPVRLDFVWALITPPQPFAEAERKASPLEQA